MNWSNKVQTAKRHLLRVAFRTKSDTDKDTRRYWDARWALGLHNDHISPDLRARLVSKVTDLMDKHGCETILEVGCGAYVPLRGIKGVTHLDYSSKALRLSRLGSYIYADVTKHIPLPDKVFDAAFCSNLLLHIKDESLERACEEVARVTKRLVILNETDRRVLDMDFGGLIVERL